MIESRKLTEILQNILRKEEITENDLKKVENISLNKKMLNGKENDIELKEIEKIPNLKTITISNFEIDNQILEIINNHKKLKILQFSRCEFKEILPINKNIKYIVIDKCQNFKCDLINNNEIVRIIDAKVELSGKENLKQTKELYLQNCEIKNSIKLCEYQKLKTLNLDGSKFEKDIINNINKNIKLSCKDTYNPIEE